MTQTKFLVTFSDPDSDEKFEERAEDKETAEKTRRDLKQAGWVKIWVKEIKET